MATRAQILERLEAGHSHERAARKQEGLNCVQQQPATRELTRAN